MFKKDRLQCLYYALDKWNEEGGYLLLRKSDNWPTPHVLHMDRRGRVTHYIPHKKLSHPFSIIFGFKGKVAYGDESKAGKMSSIGVLLGTALTLVLGAVWFTKRKIIDPIFKFFR